VAPERQRPEAYFEAALALLAERGPGDLTIAALCTRLSVTKGSFYHHFSDLAEFVDRLLEYWADEHATRLIALSESITDPAERFDLLEGIAVGLPHGAEAAIRAWSWSNESVAVAQRAVDRARLDHLAATAERAGHSPERARLMASISLSLLVGMQQLEHPASTDSMERVFSELRRWVAESVAP
jgi:AcrR family transcriptional regulator